MSPLDSQLKKGCVCVCVWVCVCGGGGVCVGVCGGVCVKGYTSFTRSVDFLFKFRSLLAALSRKTKQNKTNKQTKPNQNQNARFAYIWLMCSTKYWKFNIYHRIRFFFFFFFFVQISNYFWKHDEFVLSWWPHSPDPSCPCETQIF